MVRSKDPCKACACKIQKCLQENHFQEAACVQVLEEMKECCNKWADVSICCSGINIDSPAGHKKEQKTKKVD